MKILIVEDDVILSNTIKQCIIEKWNIEQAYNGYDGYMFAKNNIYDAIILDLMLPEMSGYEVLEKLRNNKVETPVLILTAKTDINDKIKGFKLGADDYLSKPFDIDELVARLNAIIKRTMKLDYSNDILNYRQLKLNLKSRCVSIKGKDVCIPGKQFDILECLISKAGTIVTKEQLFDKIWGFDSFTTTNVVEVYTSSLRKELKKYNYDKYIKTVRGVGYMLEV